MSDIASDPRLVGMHTNPSTQSPAYQHLAATADERNDIVSRFAETIASLPLTDEQTDLQCEERAHIERLCEQSHILGYSYAEYVTEWFCVAADPTRSVECELHASRVPVATYFNGYEYDTEYPPTSEIEAWHRRTSEAWGECAGKEGAHFFPPCGMLLSDIPHMD